MESSTSLPGARIGKFRLIKHIATGGMGSVYKAQDEETGAIVALKVLSPELSGNPITVERFKREARHATILSHKNIVTVLGADESDGLHYLVMEYIQGVDLAEYIRRKSQVQHEEARRIIIQACKALEHAFAQGIIHRDIKPSNFLLANEEGRCRVKLTDLGLSRMECDEEFRVTRAGTTVGTVDYMSPEQARDSGLADIRSDIYSLGCTFYHMLAGRPPFAEGGIGARVYKHMAADPPDIREFNPGVPAPLWTVIRRMLAKHPDDRFQTPTEVIEALRSFSESTGPSLDSEERDSSGEVELPEPSTPEQVEVSPPASPSSESQPVRPPSPPVQPAAPAARAPSPKRAAPAKPKRQTTMPEMNTISDAPADLLGVSPEQRQAAAAQYTRATELMRAGGETTYAEQLLLSCCKLDPSNILYRKMFREVVRDQGGKRGGWFGSLSHLPARRRLQAALRAGEHRKVLEDGEVLLTNLPGDVPIQLAMAEAAVALRVPALATWLLQEARAGASENLSVLRALAKVYADQKQYKQAIAVLENIQKLDPNDDEARAKIRELAVNETLSRGNYRV